MKMDWQLSQPGMAPISQRFGGILAAAVESIKPMWKVVRACNFSFRRSRQSPSKRVPLRRVPLPTKLQRPGAFAVVEAVAPTIERKRERTASASGQRNEEEEDSSMRPAKRRHLDFDTPWKDQAWLKEHIKDFTPPEISSTRQIVAPHESPVIRRSPPKRSGYEPRFDPYTRSTRRKPVQMDRAIHLYREDPNAMQFLWTSDDEDERSPSPEPTPVREELPSQKNNTKAEQESVPVRPDPPKEPTPPPSDSEADWDPANEADPEEALRWRRFLRAHPESVDERGFKVPIDGIISPETQAWNKQHEKNLGLREAAEQQTPSKPPPTSVSHLDLAQSSETRKVETDEAVLSPLKNLWNGLVSIFSPRSEQQQPTRQARPAVKEGSPMPTPMEGLFKEAKPVPSVATIEEDTRSTEMTSSETTTEDETPSLEPATQTETSTNISSPATSTKAEESTETKPSEKAPYPFETPAKQLAGLTLRDTRTPSQPFRTPKASIHQTVKTDRKTRAQKLFEEREARKDAYKLVPLSKEWDAKVRHAVQQGVKDNEGYTKYNDTDLARVVPQYARGGVHDNWLNDAVVNDYITLCVKHGNKDDRPTQVPTFAAFSSQTWQKIQSDPKSVPTRWWKRQGIQGKRALECNTIFMPINTGSHWTLAVIQPKLKNITMYNSMGYGRNQSVAETIFEFMKQEVGASLIEEEWTINARGLSPQQRNSDDCGVFSITTARQVVLGKMEKETYSADIIPVQRKRIVAELVNEGLLSTEESAGDGSVKGKEKQ